MNCSALEAAQWFALGTSNEFLYLCYSNRLLVPVGAQHRNDGGSIGDQRERTSWWVMSSMDTKEGDGHMCAVSLLDVPRVCLEVVGLWEEHETWLWVMVIESSHSSTLNPKDDTPNEVTACLGLQWQGQEIYKSRHFHVCEWRHQAGQ